MDYYVLACDTGREDHNIGLLKKTVRRLLPGSYFDAWSPVRESKEFCAKTWTMQVRPMLPGYIIAVSDTELWRIKKEILSMSSSSHGFLRNPDGSYELKGSDRQFAAWIEENKGYFRPSKVIIDKKELNPNDRIRVLSGPMKELEGRVTSIYKNTRVSVEVVFLGEVRKLTLPIEVVEVVKEDPLPEGPLFNVQDQD